MTGAPRSARHAAVLGLATAVLKSVVEMIAKRATVLFGRWGSLGIGAGLNNVDYFVVQRELEDVWTRGFAVDKDQAAADVSAWIDAGVDVDQFARRVLEPAAGTLVRLGGRSLSPL